MPARPPSEMLFVVGGDGTQAAANLLYEAAKQRGVPISIIGTHLFQQPHALPFASPRGVRIVCHPPIDAPDGPKEEEAAMETAREAIRSALPPSMQPEAA